MSSEVASGNLRTSEGKAKLQFASELAGLGKRKSIFIRVGEHRLEGATACGTTPSATHPAR